MKSYTNGFLFNAPKPLGSLWQPVGNPLEGVVGKAVMFFHDLLEVLKKAIGKVQKSVNLRRWMRWTELQYLIFHPFVVVTSCHVTASKVLS